MCVCVCVCEFGVPCMLSVHYRAQIHTYVFSLFYVVCMCVRVLLKLAVWVSVCFSCNFVLYLTHAVTCSYVRCLPGLWACGLADWLIGWLFVYLAAWLANWLLLRACMASVLLLGSLPGRLPSGGSWWFCSGSMTHLPPGTVSTVGFRISTFFCRISNTSIEYPNIYIKISNIPVQCPILPWNTQYSCKMSNIPV